MGDQELVDYARYHSRTERALFHAEHLRRLLTLAGVPIPASLAKSASFHSAFSDDIDPLLVLIKARGDLLGVSEPVSETTEVVVRQRPKLQLIYGGQHVPKERT